MNSPSKPLPTPHRSPCMDPAFIFSFKWDSWMPLYVSPPSTLVREGVGNDDLMSVAFSMVRVLNNSCGGVWEFVLALCRIRDKYLVSDTFWGKRS